MPAYSHIWCKLSHLATYLRGFFPVRNRYLAPRHFFGANPFMLWLAPAKKNQSLVPRQELGKEPDHSARTRGLVNVDTGYRLYLYPDGLRKWHLGMLLAVSIPFVLISWYWTLALIIIYGTSYWLLYHYFRRPVLSKAMDKMPQRLDDWWIGLVEKVTLTARHSREIETSNQRADRRIYIMTGGDGGSRPRLLSWCRWCFIRRYNPPGWKRPRAQYGMNSREDALLNAGMADFFEYGQPEQARGWIHFGAYWCAPVWISYVLLYIPLIATFSQIPQYLEPWTKNTFLQIFIQSFYIGKEDAGKLAVPLVAWVMGSVYFFSSLQNIFRDRVNWDVTEDKLRNMPTILYTPLKKGMLLPKIITEQEFRSSINIIQVAAFGNYAVLLAVLTNVIK